MEKAQLGVALGGTAVAVPRNTFVGSVVIEMAGRHTCGVVHVLKETPQTLVSSTEECGMRLGGMVATFERPPLCRGFLFPVSQ